MTRGRAKPNPSKLGPDVAGIQPVAADALMLPFADGTFRGIVIGFGLRNLADIEAGLVEIRRVLEPGGRLVVLEFTTPPGRVFRALYHAYFHRALPRLGGLISGQPAAARYLPDSVAAFPRAVELADSWPSRASSAFAIAISRAGSPRSTSVSRSSPPVRCRGRIPKTSD